MSAWKEKRVIGNAILYMGDCLEILPTLPKVDAVVTDPPYGIGYQHGGRDITGGKTRKIEGDDKPFDPTPWLQQIPTILWGGNYYASRLPETKSWLVWDKRCGTTSDDGADCEMAWTNINTQARIFRHLWRGFMRDGEENLAKGTSAWKMHPAQKPVALMSWCIKLCDLQPKAVILDPYMGSASCGVSAVRDGYQYIGCETDETHYHTACERIENAQRQQRMFA